MQCVDCEFERNNFERNHAMCFIASVHINSNIFSRSPRGIDCNILQEQVKVGVTLNLLIACSGINEVISMMTI